MGSIVCFALFLGAVGVCLAEGWQLMWAIWAGIAVFAVLGLARHVPVRVMAAGAWRQGRKMCSVIDIYLLIGAITALWRSAGTIGFFIYHGLQIITPQMFLLVAFLLTSFISYALGTSFGVVGTVGVILMALARSGGVDAAVTAGPIIAGAYFGDRCSPASSSAALVAAATGTALERNLRRMHRTGWLPYVVSLAVYAALSVTHPLAAVDGQVLTTLAETYRLGWWTALPAAAIIVLPLCRVSIRRSMAVSVLAALAVTLWGQGGRLWDVLRDTVLGYRPAGGTVSRLRGGVRPGGHDLLQPVCRPCGGRPAAGGDVPRPGAGRRGAGAGHRKLRHRDGAADPMEHLGIHSAGDAGGGCLRHPL